MKSLSDGIEVSVRSYYFLLDWNEQDEWRYMKDNFGKEKLKELTIHEYFQLFNHATGEDCKSLLSKFILT